jgi:hypothetical protein
MASQLPKAGDCVAGGKNQMQFLRLRPGRQADTANPAKMAENSLEKKIATGEG